MAVVHSSVIACVYASEACQQIWYLLTRVDHSLLDVLSTLNMYLLSVHVDDDDDDDERMNFIVA